MKSGALISVCAALLMAGCAGASSDPHTGGLIGGIHGITTGAYDRRIADKEAEVADLEAAGDALSRRVGSAEDRLRALDRALVERQSKIEKMKADIAEIDRLLASGKVRLSAGQGTLSSIEADNARKAEILRPLAAERDMLAAMVRDLEQSHIVEARNYQNYKSQGVPGGGGPSPAGETQMADIEKRIQEFEKKRVETALRIDRAKQSAMAVGGAG